MLICWLRAFAPLREAVSIDSLHMRFFGVLLMAFTKNSQIKCRWAIEVYDYHRNQSEE